MPKYSRILLLLLAAAVLLTFAACTGKTPTPPDIPDTPDTPDTPDVPDDGRIRLDKDASVTVYYSSSLYNSAAVSFAGIFRSAGINNVKVTSKLSSESSDYTVYVGRFDHPLSAKAKEKADADSTLRPGDLFYYIESEGNAVAVYLTDSKIAPAALNALAAKITATGDGIVAEPNLSLSYVYTAEQQEADRIAEEERLARLEAERIAAYKKQADADWETRFDKIEDPELKTAMERFYDFYDPDALVTWWGNLWDPEIGGFYYANSARDYVGFLPDMESTYQILAKIYTNSAFMGYNRNLTELLGRENAEKIIGFYQTKQDPNTGYFFHPQWPQNTASLNTMRYTRDQDWATSVLSWLGSKPLYPTALDRLKNTASAGSFKTVTSLVGTLPYAKQPVLLAAQDWQANRASIYQYLDHLFATQSCESWSNTLSTQVSSFEAAGVLGDVLDYLDETINPEYGLWVQSKNKEAGNYVNTKGEVESAYGICTMSYKIMVLYADGKRPVPYADKMAEACIEAILSRKLSVRVTYLFNPWATLSKIRDDLAYIQDPEVKANFNRLMKENGVAMINAAIAELGVYKCPDGSFGFLPEGSSPTIYGTTVSLGFKEGDVNGNNLVMSFSYHICNALGLDTIPVFYYKHAEKLVQTMNAVEVKPKKRMVTPGCTYDFESTVEGKLPIGASVVSSADKNTFAVITDPIDPRNNVLMIEKATETQVNGGSMQITCAEKTECGNDTVISTKFRFYVSSATAFGSSVTSQSNLTAAQMRFMTGDKALFMMTVSLNTKSPTGFYLGAAKSTKGGYAFVHSTANGGTKYKFDTWYEIRVDLHITDAGKATAALNADIFVDGEKKFSTDCFYSDSNYSENVSTSGTLSVNESTLGLRIQPMARMHVLMYIDDLSTSFDEYKAD